MITNNRDKITLQVKKRLTEMRNFKIHGRVISENKN